MSSSAIRVSDLSKEYRVAPMMGAHDTFYELLANTISSPFNWMQRRDQRDITSTNFLALNNVNFNVEPGEVVGVIGRNGAGKSTLLKILSRITAPTKGRVEVRGRLASLLEVGTGFHPELTGRENIFLNGAILGMSKREVMRKFDEIVDFSEIGQFLDTPVKRYSSGMYVRLAFSVAAHLETDVLIVDEVLAVGDAVFQRKCLGKMGNVAQGGKTVFLVSHNLAAVRNLCTRALLFEKGGLVYDGLVGRAIEKYESLFSATGGKISGKFSGNLIEEISFDKITCLQDNMLVDVVSPLSKLVIEVEGHSRRKFQLLDLRLGLYREGMLITSLFDTADETPMEAGAFKSSFVVEADILVPGRYVVGVGASSGVGRWIWGNDVSFIDVSSGAIEDKLNRVEGSVRIPYEGHRQQSFLGRGL